MSYAETEMYAPYIGNSRSLVKQASTQLEAGNIDGCLEATESIFKTNYTSLGGHYLAMICNFEAKKESKGKYHRYVLEGLVNSIAENGDGASPSTAHTTISTDELNEYLQIIGFELVSQALLNTQGNAFDIMRVKNPETGKELTIYFDITIQMTKGMRFLEK
jgi:hypothetical protein